MPRTKQTARRSSSKPAPSELPSLRKKGISADSIYTEKSSMLDKLPTELIDRICDYFPNQDTMYYLRATCRSLEAKTREKYAKACWKSSFWLLSAAGFRSFIVMAAKHETITPYVTALTLAAPCGHRDYDSYLRAKRWSKSSVLAKNCSKLLNLRTLTLLNFCFKRSKNYLKDFCQDLRLPDLVHLNINEMVVEDVDLAALIENHKKKLHHVVLQSVDVYGGAESGATAEWDDGRFFPWTRVFEGLLRVRNQCFIQIENAKHRGSLVNLYQDDTPDCNSDGIMEFWGTTIQLAPDFTDGTDEVEGFHELIRVNNDEHWKRGIHRLIQMYNYSIYDSDGDGTPPWAFDNDDSVDADLREREEKDKTREDETPEDKMLEDA
jgi:hypothetical protein